MLYEVDRILLYNVVVSIDWYVFYSRTLSVINLLRYPQ